MSYVHTTPTEYTYKIGSICLKMLTFLMHRIDAYQKYRHVSPEKAKWALNQGNIIWK